MSQLKRRGILYCIVGPAGSGKTSLSEELLKASTLDLKVSISVTTRTPRPDEADGTSYHFVSDAEFDQLISQSKFVEWESVHGFRYGTLKKSMKDAVEAGQDLMLRIDIRGASNLKKIYPRDTVIIFLLPPSFSDLEQRLLNRAAINNSKLEERELQVRLQTAKDELLTLSQELHSGLIDYVLINQDFQLSLQHLISILNAERLKAERIHFESIRNIV